MDEAPPPRLQVKSVLKALLLACALGLPLWALWQQRHGFLEALATADPGLVAGVGLGLLLYTLCNASIWADVLRALGWRGSRLQATRTWVECEALKWLPGGIWGYASRVVRAPALGTTRSIAGASLVAELLLTIAAWALLALLGLALDPGLRSLLLEKLTGSQSSLANKLFWLLPLLALLGGATLLALAPVRRAIQHRLAPLRISGWRPGPLLRALASYLTLCAFHALLLVFLVQAVFPAPYSWASAAAADGSAWLIGFFAIGVPGGIGVREAGITFFLSTHLSTPEAMAVAVLWRVLQIAAELTSFALSKLLSKRLSEPCTRQ
ncbi:lysylphosphatidylglycerol synthase domain-containing protein [Roseibacillus ishigakijimensis]|uniref:Flippase-like domain-containing protein n=1 Tax=Roseibacillus ishigakijimensis TaxID=454146 RepID=A0A934VG85_9BACT|nr:lysylphosphatidylglycerol synthase domain-containing protein [Roseibacillus ishigakijimensis]MBK1832578.1 flippase-like domain-containing protein [Roseibacillus ishigakijimensis]